MAGLIGFGSTKSFSSATKHDMKNILGSSVNVVLKVLNYLQYEKEAICSPNNSICERDVRLKERKPHRIFSFIIYTFLFWPTCHF